MECLNKKDDFNALIEKMKTTPECVPMILDEIFSRCYEDFDKAIKAYLACCGFDINSERFDQLYLEWIFPDIYDRVFCPHIYMEKIVKYDSQKSFFTIWFKTVIRNTVRDWLRKVDDKTGLSNFERLRETVDLYKKTEILGYESEFADDWPDSDTGDKNLKLWSIFSALKPKYRTILRVCYLAYIDLTPHDVESISQISKKGEMIIEQEITDIKDQLKNGKSYAESLKILNKINSETFSVKLKNSEQQLYQVRNILEAFGTSEKEIKEVEELAIRKTQKAIGEEQKQIRKTPKGGNNCDNNYTAEFLNLAINQYMLAYKECVKYRKKQENYIELLKTGKVFKAQPSRFQLASLYNKNEQFVDNLKVRAKQSLKKAFEESAV